MTLLPWREHPAAREELRLAAHWYEDKDRGLGERLTSEVDDAIAFIRALPDVAPLYRGRKRLPVLRRKGIQTFPYGIIYFVRGDEVIIIAYAHAKRRPGYWRERLAAL